MSAENKESPPIGPSGPAPKTPLTAEPKPDAPSPEPDKKNDNEPTPAPVNAQAQENQEEKKSTLSPMEELAKMIEDKFPQGYISMAKDAILDKLFKPKDTVQEPLEDVKNTPEPKPAKEEKKEEAAASSGLEAKDAEVEAPELPPEPPTPV